MGFLSHLQYTFFAACNIDKCKNIFYMFTMWPKQRHMLAGSFPIWNIVVDIVIWKKSWKFQSSTNALVRHLQRPMAIWALSISSTRSSRGRILALAIAIANAFCMWHSRQIILSYTQTWYAYFAHLVWNLFAALGFALVRFTAFFAKQKPMGSTWVHIGFRKGCLGAPEGFH